MDTELKQRLDTTRARAFLRDPANLAHALRVLFPQPALGALADTSRLKQLNGHTARTRHLGQGVCRVLIGDGWIRPITPTPDKRGSGGRRTRQKREARPGHDDKHGIMTFGHATLTRKGLDVLTPAPSPLQSQEG